MKKNLIIALIFIFLFAGCKLKSDNVQKTIVNYRNNIIDSIPQNQHDHDEGCFLDNTIEKAEFTSDILNKQNAIDNEQKALEIGKILIQSIFDIHNNEYIYVAVFCDKYDAWIVSAKKENDDLISAGGGYNIAISRVDCKVISCWITQ